jgi:hypothetical protein
LRDADPRGYGQLTVGLVTTTGCPRHTTLHAGATHSVTVPLATSWKSTVQGPPAQLMVAVASERTATVQLDAPLQSHEHDVSAHASEHAAPGLQSCEHELVSAAQLQESPAHSIPTLSSNSAAQPAIIPSTAIHRSVIG